MRGPRALEMLKASREGSCPQGVPRQPLTHKRAPEVGTSGLLPASAPSGLWHPSRAILPRRTMETERRHATGAACAPLGRGRVPCSRSSAGPVHLCKTQSCRAWPCSVRLPASLGAVCGCVDGCPELPRRRARSSRGAPRSAAHPQRTSAPARRTTSVRPSVRSSARPHHTHTPEASQSSLPGSPSAPRAHGWRCARDPRHTSCLASGSSKAKPRQLASSRSLY